MKWVPLDSFQASGFSTSNLGNNCSFVCGLCAITCETMNENAFKALTFFPLKKIINDYMIHWCSGDIRTIKSGM